MTQDDDWRLQTHDDSRNVATIVWRRYQDVNPPGLNPDWDHDHCDFCWAKFMARDDLPDVLQEGFTNAAQEVRPGRFWPEGTIWICPQCFTDFRDRFHWVVVNVETEGR